MHILEILKNALSGVGSIVDALVYAAIVLLFIIGIVKCILPVVGTRGMLRRATHTIRQGDKAKRSWQDEKFLGRGELYPHWSEYLNNLFFADGEYHNASNVEDYINEETVIYGPGRQAFADAVPGLLVSLGFLGTLVGLARGLAGFNMTDSAAVQESIMTLIPGMRYAFMTSIVGVVCSIVFSMILRSVNGSTQRTLRNFYGAMSRYAGVLSVDPMTQIAIYQQEQTALIQTMAKDLNGAFTQKITEAMAKTAEPINQTLKNFVTVTTQEQIRLLDAVAQRLVSRTDEMFRGELDRLSKVMEQTSSRQEQTFAAVDACMIQAKQSLEAAGYIRDAADRITEKFTACVEGIANNQAQIDDAYVRVSGNVERMELISRQQTTYLKTVSAMQSSVTKALEDMKQSTDEFTKALEKRETEVTNSMCRSAEGLRDAAESIARAHAETGAAMDRELKDTLDSFAAYATEFNRRIDQLTNSIAGSLEQLPQAVDDAGGRMLDEIDRMGATLQDARRALDDAVDRLYGVKSKD